jgi:hypothetical protein
MSGGTRTYLRKFHRTFFSHAQYPVELRSYFTGKSIINDYSDTIAAQNARSTSAYDRHGRTWRDDEQCSKRARRLNENATTRLKR